MRNLRSSRRDSQLTATTASKILSRQNSSKSEPTLLLSHDTLKRVPNSEIAKMNIDLSTEQLERQLCPPDVAPLDIGFGLTSFFDPLVDGSVDSCSSPAASFGSDDYEDTFNRENDLICNDPSTLTGMNINFDQYSTWIPESPESMAGSPMNENDRNIENLETCSRSDSLLVPDSSQGVVSSLVQSFYFPSQDIEKYENGGFEELLNDAHVDVDTEDSVLDDIMSISSQDLSSQESTEYVYECSNIVVQQQQAVTDNFTYATGSQLQGGGIEVFVLPSQPGAGSPDSATISAGPSYIATSPEVSSCESEESVEPKKRGRKRKADGEEFMTPSQRKRKQNADAAKRYRQKKEIEQKKIIEEREKVEKELETTRRKVQKKMDERNTLLKLIYDSYHDPKSTLKEKYSHIKFPKWLPKWYKTESDDSS